MNKSKFYKLLLVLALRLCCACSADTITNTDGTATPTPAPAATPQPTPKPTPWNYYEQLKQNPDKYQNRYKGVSFPTHIQLPEYSGPLEYYYPNNYNDCVAYDGKNTYIAWDGFVYALTGDETKALYYNYETGEDIDNVLVYNNTYIFRCNDKIFMPWSRYSMACTSHADLTVKNNMLYRGRDAILHKDSKPPYFDNVNLLEDYLNGYTTGNSLGMVFKYKTYTSGAIYLVKPDRYDNVTEKFAGGFSAYSSDYVMVTDEYVF